MGKYDLDMASKEPQGTTTNHLQESFEKSNLPFEKKKWYNIKSINPCLTGVSGFCGSK